MRQAVIVNGRLDAPPARRTASADAESRYPVAGHRLRSNAFRREVPSHKVVLHAPWLAVRDAIEFVFLTGCRVSIQNPCVYTASRYHRSQACPQKLRA